MVLADWARGGTLLTVDKRTLEGFAPMIKCSDFCSNSCLELFTRSHPAIGGPESMLPVCAQTVESRVLPRVVSLSGPGDGYCHLWPLCLFYILFHNCSETGSMDYGFSLLQGTLRDDASLSIAHEETPYNGICNWGLEPLSWKVSSGL